MEQSVREPRPEKVAVVDEVRERFGSASAAILTEYRGLHVSEMEALRRALSAAGGEYKVYKNTLVRRAAHEAGLDQLDSLLEGPTGIAFVGDDVASVAKALRDFARANPALVVKGGLIGSSLLDARSAAALAELPSREVLLAQLAGMLAAPMQRFAGLLAALPQKLAYGLQALVDQRVAGGEALPGDEAPAAEAPAAEAPAPAASGPAVSGGEAVSADQGEATGDAPVAVEASEDPPADGDAPTEGGTSKAAEEVPAESADEDPPAGTERDEDAPAAPAESPE